MKTHRVEIRVTNIVVDIVLAHNIKIIALETVPIQSHVSRRIVKLGVKIMVVKTVPIQAQAENSGEKYGRGDFPDSI